MLARLKLYWENSTTDDRCVLALLLLPGVLCFTGRFPNTLPFWLLGGLAGMVAHRRFPKPGLRLLLALAVLVVAGTGLVENDLLSARWTAPISQLLWFALGATAGMHFGSVSRMD